ncbi:unnamed protein product, partial [Pocillopora meandrina]
IPRTTARQQHRVNVPTTNPESYWQRAVYLPPTDHHIQEINDRLLSREDRFLAQYLLPINLQGFGNDRPHSTEERPTTLADTLDCIKYNSLSKG